MAEHNVERSAQPSGIAFAPSPLSCGRTSAAGSLTCGCPARTAGVSTLDLLGDGLTLFTGPEAEPWEALAAASEAARPVAVRSLDQLTARALGIARRGRSSCVPTASRRACGPTPSAEPRAARGRGGAAKAARSQPWRPDPGCRLRCHAYRKATRFPIGPRIGRLPAKQPRGGRGDIRPLEESPDTAGQGGRGTDPAKAAGKCHRNTPPMARPQLSRAQARVKRCGKSAPASR